MALTVQQEIALFQILEVPWQPLVMKPAGADYLIHETNDVTTSIRQARQRILDYLTVYIYSSAQAEVVLTAYLDRWIEIGTNVVNIDSGSTGAVGGVTSRPDDERLEIQKQVKVVVPFYRAHVEIERASAAGTTVAIIR